MHYQHIRDNIMQLIKRHKILAIFTNGVVIFLYPIYNFVLSSQDRIPSHYFECLCKV